MKFTIAIDNDREEEVLVYAHKETKLTKEIERLVLSDEYELIGYKDKSAVRLDIEEVYCFSIEDNKVCARTHTEKLWLKCRLYQLEENLPQSFVKINQSCIANLNAIQRFDTSFSGTLKVIFKNGHSDYVSRRQLKNVKERLGL